MGRKHKQRNSQAQSAPTLNLDDRSTEQLKQLVIELQATLDRKDYKLKRLRERDIRLGKLTDSHEEQITEMEKAHEKAFDRLESRHEKEVEKMETRHELELDELEAQQDREIEKLEEKYDDVFSDNDFDSEGEEDRDDVE